MIDETPNGAETGALALLSSRYPLHKMGWHAFQNLCAAIAEECLKRPVQTFLPSNDAGRDGAFIGRWDQEGPYHGSSTIQCKFTEKPDAKLSLSLLTDELAKVSSLAARNLANDYIILTNFAVTGSSELKIAAAFQQAGANQCRVFHRDWIIAQIKGSSRLRMLAPSLYGLGDFSDLLDSRAYAHARLILLQMKDTLSKLVVTDVHRRSVRALNEHSAVLLLGPPAAGKSTIGGSLAVGAADLWGSPTLKITSPLQLEQHLSTTTPQFLWVDDAWGSTQFQRDRIEGWNQVFPLMQAATRNGSKFLLTSRDYIWNQAKAELKLSAFPILRRSQVVIKVEEFTLIEKAQILFNHLKLGDQPTGFRGRIKPFLPQVTRAAYFSPESARRVGSTSFTERLYLTERFVLDFFEKPSAFLLETIENLSEASRAAIALIFANGGRVRSPVSGKDASVITSAFDISTSSIISHLEALDGSFLQLVADEQGSFWTYKHPTIGDAFSDYIARSPERIDIFLRGAKPITIVQEVICAGADLTGAKLVVPNTLHALLADRIEGLDGYHIASFLSYRSNASFSALMLKRRPDIMRRLSTFSRPIKEDIDASLLAALYSQGLLPEEVRSNFVRECRAAAFDEADASFLDDPEVSSVLTPDEIALILLDIETDLSSYIPRQIANLTKQWEREYDPEDFFGPLRSSLTVIIDSLGNRADTSLLRESLDKHVGEAVRKMIDDYEPPETSTAPVAKSVAQSDDDLVSLFRDVDDKN